jgi:hypothetical protein
MTHSRGDVEEWLAEKEREEGRRASWLMVGVIVAGAAGVVAAMAMIVAVIEGAILLSRQHRTMRPSIRRPSSDAGLHDDVREPGASRAWEARIAELQADLLKTPDDWADLLPAVARATREIKR